MSGPRITLAAAALTAAMLGLAGCGAGAPDPTPQPEDGPGRVVTAPDLSLLPTDVPWSRVGTGWRLAAVEEGRVTLDGVEGDTQRLTLIDPGGRRYELLREDTSDFFGGLLLTDWSADGRRALYVASPGFKRATAIAVDLVSGAVSAVRIGASADVRFRPDGALWVLDSSHVRTLDWDGTSVELARSREGGLLPAADGSVLVLGSDRASRRMRVLDAHGATVRELGGRGACRPVRWWDAGTVLATCWRGSGSRLWTVPLDGSEPTRLTGIHDLTRTYDYGDSDAYRIGDRLWLVGNPPCGGTFVADETGAAVLPEGVGSVTVLGVQGRRLAIVHRSSCDGDVARSALTLYDPLTRDEQVLVRLPKDEAFGPVLGFGPARPAMS